MKRSIFLTVLLGAALLSSCGRDQYRIHGRVTSNELEGIQVFLVPVGHEEPENVDSVRIHNHEFAFKGDRHWMCTIRLDRHHRDKGQNLLVATEPGDIYVTIGPDSSGGGTPQNDSLQLWKDLTIRFNREWTELVNTGQAELADSLRADYLDRTRQLALALGEDSIAGGFLLKMYPLPREN
ncbi:MAG: DUF4369 domain-containing protein [Bacteroidales bacterium]|nr:DUF4369 domain-containing protein [Bacteroidales bacterium]